MYRTKKETEITFTRVNVITMKKEQKTVTLDGDFSQAMLANIGNEQRISGYIALVNSAVYTTYEVPYTMDDSEFMERAERLSKPNPKYITRTEQGAEITAKMLDENGEPLEQAETFRITEKFNPEHLYTNNGHYMLEVISAKDINGIFGMKAEDYYKHAIKGERVFKSGKEPEKE